MEGFFEWVQLGIDVHISLGKHRVKLRSSPWFSAPCATDRAQKNHFFHLKQQNKSSISAANYRQASNSCKRVPESARGFLSLPTR